MNNPTKNLLDYLSIGNVYLPEDTFNLNGENPTTNTQTTYAKTEEVNNILNSQIIEPTSQDQNNSLEQQVVQPNTNQTEVL